MDNSIFAVINTYKHGRFFTDFSILHMLGLFEKLNLSILAYSSEVKVFSKANNI